MADRGKIIKGLESCIANKCRDCPYPCYCEYADDWPHELHKDTLELLKEQEAVEPFHKCIGKEFSLIEDSYFDYCPYCGKPITWAKQEGR